MIGLFLGLVFCPMWSVALYTYGGQSFRFWTRLPYACLPNCPLPVALHWVLVGVGGGVGGEQYLGVPV